MPIVPAPSPLLVREGIMYEEESEQRLKGAVVTYGATTV